MYTYNYIYTYYILTLIDNSITTVLVPVKLTVSHDISPEDLKIFTRCWNVCPLAKPEGKRTHI